MGLVEIPLTKGKVAIVDEADAELVSRYKWHASASGGDRYYARGYVLQGGKWIRVYMHRFIAGANGIEDVDHANGNTLDNRRCNLRACTHAENMRNLQARTRDGRTKGVWFDAPRNKYQAYINASGKRIHLGRFVKREDAIEAHNRAVIELHGDFAAVNK